MNLIAEQCELMYEESRRTIQTDPVLLLLRVHRTKIVPYMGIYRVNSGCFKHINSKMLYIIKYQSVIYNNIKPLSSSPLAISLLISRINFFGEKSKKL